jgi:uncharacterized protein (TIGR00290 family)
MPIEERCAGGEGFVAGSPAVSLTREPVALSWSGGKDSALALAALREDPRFEVVALMTSVTREYDRISIHGVRRVLLEAQVAATGLPLIEVTLEPQCSNDAYEAAFLDAAGRLRDDFPDVATVGFGDLFLEDVRTYREGLLRRAGLTGCFPLWGRDTRQLAREFIAAGFVAHLACVDTTQLDARFAGRRFDDRLLDDLPPSVDPCGERGEFHTFVAAGPIFPQPIAVSCGEVVLRDGRFAYCDIVPS